MLLHQLLVDSQDSFLNGKEVCTNWCGVNYCGLLLHILFSAFCTAKFSLLSKKSKKLYYFSFVNDQNIRIIDKNSTFEAIIRRSNYNYFFSYNFIVLVLFI